MRITVQNIPVLRVPQNPKKPIKVAQFTVKATYDETERLGILDDLEAVSYEETRFADLEKEYNKMFDKFKGTKGGKKVLQALFRILRTANIINCQSLKYMNFDLVLFPKYKAERQRVYLIAAVVLTLNEEGLRNKMFLELLKSRDCDPPLELEFHFTPCYDYDSLESMTPSKIKEFLDTRVISQNDAKKAVAVAAYDHMRRLRLAEAKDDDPVTIEKTNVLLAGPTGTGKTEIVNSIAELMNVPVAKISAATLTASGYVGDSVSSAFVRLYIASGMDKKKAERGIIFIDEIDKIASAPDHAIQRDVGGRSVQYELLRAIEGEEFTFRMANDSPDITLNTKNILFLCAGAFDGMDEKIKATTPAVIGFGKTEAPKEEMGDYAEKLISYGLIPELVGRIPILTRTEALSVQELAKILTEPQNALLKQYQRRFELDGVALTFDDDAVEALANKAIQFNTGARALRSVVEKSMRPLLYEIPDRKDISAIRITKDFVENKGDAVFKCKKRALPRKKAQ